MANDDEAGARAAADYFLALYGYTYQAGDYTLLDAFCHDESTFCAGVEKELLAYDAAGHAVVGGDLTWTGEPSVVRRADTSSYVIEGTLHQSAASLVTDESSIATTMSAGESLVTVFVYFEAGEWSCFDLSLPDPQ